MLDLPERLASVSAGRLQDIVREALGESGTVLGRWDAAPLRGGFGALAGESSLYLVTGTARVGVAERPWSVVLKLLASVAGPDDPTHIRYQRRVLLLSRSNRSEERGV